MCFTSNRLFNAFAPCHSPSFPSLANIPLTPETARDQERRIRREIANSNERRRMQSINAGFQSLKTLIPHSDGEKLSKVSHKGRPELDDELDVAVRVSPHLHHRPVTEVLFSLPARLPSCNRQQTTFSHWSRRRRGYCSRTVSSSESFK